LDSISRQVGSVSERYGLPIEPDRFVHSLSVGERQRVEIIRCLLQNPKLLILDEPTSVLTPQAVLKLFDVLRKLTSEGCSILYISHKLEEVRSLSSIATVLRAGRVIALCDPRTQTSSSLASMMIGSGLPLSRIKKVSERGDEALLITGLTRPAEDPSGTGLNDIHLSVRTGEILGIAGISGNGQQAFLEAVSGEWRATKRLQIQICGVGAGHMSPFERRKLGMCFVPEERLGRGAVPELSLADNSLLTASRNGMVKSGMVHRAAVTAFAERCIRDFTVRCSGVDAKAKSLSGGNLQRFIVGREILQRPKLLVISQPTWGLDVGAAAFIHETLISLRSYGTGVLVISEELEELFAICDSIAVMANGHLSPARLAKETSIEEIGLLMGGVWPTTTQARNH
jgi:general nucleoside transport system ATP-binding protein